MVAQPITQADGTGSVVPWRARRISVVVTLAVIAAVAVEPVRVPTGSMAPTLAAGDQLVVDKIGHRLSAPDRGDLVVFRAPNSADLMVKRLVAAAGDTVGLEDGVLVVNGRPVDEIYVDQRLIDGVYFGPTTVPPGCLFVLGDDRANSVDSRSFGPVRVSDLVGVATVRIWPPAWLR